MCVPLLHRLGPLPEPLFLARKIQAPFQLCKPLSLLPDKTNDVLDGGVTPQGDFIAQNYF